MGHFAPKIMVVSLVSVGGGAAIWGFDDLKASPAIAADIADSGSADDGGTDAAGEVDTGAPGARGPYAAAVLADQPIAYWPLDELSGVIAHDVAGGHDATVAGTIAWGAPGAVGTGIQLGGAGCLNAGLVAGLEGDLTIEAWTWMPAHTDKVMLGGGWDIRFSDDAAPLPLFETIANNACSGTLGLDRSRYAHLAVTLAGTHAAIYVDGVAAGTGTVQPIGTAAAPLQIGGDSRGPFQGMIDEVAVYGHALLDERILAHVQAAK